MTQLLSVFRARVNARFKSFCNIRNRCHEDILEICTELGLKMTGGASNAAEFAALQEPALRR
jgi:hypothetical protein